MTPVNAAQQHPPLHERMATMAGRDIPVWVYDMDQYAMLWANPRALKFWDADSLDELMQRDFKPASAVAIENIERYKRDLEFDTPFHDTWTFYRDNQPVCFAVQLAGIATNDNRKAMLVQLVNIIDSHQETLYSIQALANTSVMINFYNCEGELIFSNPAARRAAITDDTRLQNRFVNPQIAQRLIENSDKKLRSMLSEPVNTNTGVEWHDIEVSYSLDTITGKTNILLSEVNASEKNRFKEAGQLSDKIFESMVASSLDAVLVCDDLTILLANQAACDIFKVDDCEALVGQSIISLANPQDADNLQNYVSKKTDSLTEDNFFSLNMARSDGSEFRARVIGVDARYQSRSVSHIMLRDIESSIRAVEAIQRSEEKLRQIINSVGDGLIGLDQTGSVTSINLKGERIIGLGASDVMGKNIIDVLNIVEQEQKILLIERVRDAFVYGKVLSAEKTIEVINGQNQHRHIIYTLQPVRNSDNIIVETEIIFRDLTDLHSKERHLSMLQSLIDKSADGALIIEQSGDIYYANETLCQRLGYSSEELLNLNVVNISPTFSESNWKDHWNRVKKYGNLSFEATQKTRTGKTLAVELNVKHFSFDNKEYHLSFSSLIGNEYGSETGERAQIDTLTQTANRTLFLQYCTEAIEANTDSSSTHAILFLDLDNFKKVNDVMGHVMGDQLLMAVAKRIEEVTGKEGYLARIGSDEFAILLTNLDNPKQAEKHAQKLLEKFLTPFNLDNNLLHITCSIGIAVYPQDGKESLDLIRRADMAMYQSKIKAPNNYKRYSDNMHQLAKLRLEREEKLRTALKNNELSVNYQPIIDLKTDAIIGAEALLRWHNPQLGHISPLDFIPIAEQTNLIIPIGEFVIENALQQLVEWKKTAASETMMVSINVSSVQLTNPLFLDFLSAQIDRHGVDPKSVLLEITESVLLDNQDEVRKILDAISATGVQLAMDDFGTGYSSLTYLRRHPFDVLKIDKEFIDDFLDDSSDNEIVRASIAIAHSMNMAVIAEGVEEAHQGEHLKTMNADWVQGYYYSKPVSEQVMLDLLKESS